MEVRMPDSLDYERPAAALQPFVAPRYLTNTQLDEVGMYAARVAGRAARTASFHAHHQIEVSAALARGECPDCGKALTSPGAPGICAAGHTPEEA